MSSFGVSTAIRAIRKLLLLGSTLTLMILGAATLTQLTGVAPAVAAGSTDGLFGWGYPWGSTPTVENLPTGVTPVAVASNGPDNYAIGSDGNAYAWGESLDGSLGDGSGISVNEAPVVVSLPSGITATALAATSDSAFAIGSDGNIYAWGDNTYGELGIGTNTGPATCPGYGPNYCSTTPVEVSLPRGVTATAIAGSGSAMAFALGSDGKIYAWGQGALGVAGTTQSDSPIVVSLPTGVTATALSGAGDGGYAIGSDGNVYAWGDNETGALGNGTTTVSLTPIEVPLPMGVSPVAITGFSRDYGGAYLIGSDGNLYAWGANTSGELGIGGDNSGPDNCSTYGLHAIFFESCSLSPIRVPLPAGVNPRAVTGYDDGGTMIGSDGNVYAWGDNVGDGSSAASNSPVVVSLPSGSLPVSLSESAIAGSTNYVIADAPDVAPTITTNPTNQSVDSGLPVTFTAAASGYPTPTIQWEVSTDGGSSFSPVSGATSDTLSIANAKLAENGDEYEAVFTNGTGSDATTTAAVLSVTPSVAPVVTTNPLSQTASYGGTLTFSAAASGTPTPTVQWQLSVDGGSSWFDVAGLTLPSFTSGPLTLFENGWEIRAVFTNVAGTVTTKSATAIVTVPPPTTAVTLPSNGATVAGNTWLDAVAQSPVGVASVRFEVSGGLVSDLMVDGSTDTEWGWIGAWDTTDVPNGTYTLQSVATDNDGTSTTSAGVTVTVDNPGLHTQVLVPVSGASLTGPSAVLDASAAGTADITGVQFLVSGGSLSDDVVGTATLTLYGWIVLWDTTSVPNGAYTLESVATEAGGTTATSTGVTVTVGNSG